MLRVVFRLPFARAFEQRVRHGRFRSVRRCPRRKFEHLAAIEGITNAHWLLIARRRHDRWRRRLDVRNRRRWRRLGRGTQSLVSNYCRQCQYGCYAGNRGDRLPSIRRTRSRAESAFVARSHWRSRSGCGRSARLREARQLLRIELDFSRRLILRGTVILLFAHKHPGYEVQRSAPVRAIPPSGSHRVLQHPVRFSNTEHNARRAESKAISATRAYGPVQARGAGTGIPTASESVASASTSSEPCTDCAASSRNRSLFSTNVFMHSSR